MDGEDLVRPQIEKDITTRKIALAVILAAVAVVLSPLVSIPLGFATPLPVQHMVNAIAGVLLGPWYAVLIAVIVGSIRNFLGTGTPLAFPGGIFGGLVVGLAYRYLLKKDYAALLEPLGTGLIGATLSAYLVGPWAYQAGLLKVQPAFPILMTSFLASSIVGSALGFAVLKIVRRTRLWT